MIMPQNHQSGTSASDLELMHRVAKRDATAQRQLVERLVRRVRRLSHLLLDDASEAEDAAQLSLLEILQSASGFRSTGPLEAWADRITARTTLRLARQLRSQRGVLDRFTDSDTVRQLFPKTQIDGAGALDLEFFLQRLPRARREAFVLKYGLGYSVEEIASITQAPPGTVKDRLIMAKRKLREMIHRDASASKKGPVT